MHPGSTTVEPLAAYDPFVTEESDSRSSRLDLLSLFVACLLFLALTLPQLDLPGLYPDEAFDVIPAMQLLLGHDVEVLDNAGLNIFGLNLPLMSSSAYQGVTSTYLAIPFFAIGGINVISLRVMTIMVGLIAIVLSFFLARAWFGAPTARLTVLLLAVSPAWVFWSRLGVYVVSEVVPIAAGAMLAFTTWVRKRPLGGRNGLFYLGAFLLGLGLTTKLLFLWVISALLICALILYGRNVWAHRKEWNREGFRWARIGSLALLSFCAGASPFLLYNVMTRGTYHLLRGSVSNIGATTHGVDNTAFIRNLWTEADAFKVLLDGGYFWFQGILSRTFSDPLTPALFAVSVIGLVALLLAQKGDLHVRSVRSVAALSLLLGISLTSSIVLALSRSTGSGAGVLQVVTIVAGIVGTSLAVATGARNSKITAVSCWLLLAITSLSGALWWFGGSGRPPGHAPDALLGLWPIDAAGILFWISAGGLVTLLALDSSPAPHQRATAAALAFIGLIVAQSIVTVSGLWSTHILVLLPLPQLVIAAFAVNLGAFLAGNAKGQRSARTMLRTLPVLLIVGSIILCDITVDYLYHADLSAGGGSSTFSDAIYRLADYLKTEKKSVVAMDWGFRRPLQFLTLEEIDPIEAYGLEAEPGDRFYESLRKLLENPDTLYLFHTQHNTAYPRRDAFMAEILAEGKTAKLERTFYQRDGSPVYEVYSVQ
jgi:hypothetical protein